MKRKAGIIMGIFLIVLSASAQDNDSIPDIVSKYKFKRWEGELYIQMGGGFVIVDAHENRGILTGNFESGLTARYNIKKYDTLWKVDRPSRAALYASLGWGPLLVAEGLVPNFANFTFGTTFNKFGSDLSYGIVVSANTSGEGPDYLYGFRVTVDKIQTPVFMSMLLEPKNKPILLAGLKIPLSSLLPDIKTRRKILKWIFSK
jgi:hypothetical protein